MKKFLSMALLCLSISVFAQSEIDYTISANQFPNAANIFEVAPGQPFSLTYRISSQIGTNARTYIAQYYEGPAAAVSLGTVPPAPDKLYIYDVGSAGVDRTLTIPANPSKAGPRRFDLVFDQCFFISAPTIEARPKFAQLGGAFGMLIIQKAANSIVTNTGTKGSQTTISLYYSINNGATWQSWNSTLSAAYANTYLLKAKFTCSSTTNLGKFVVSAFGTTQAIYDTEYEWVSVPHAFRGDETVKFTSSVSNYPMDL